MDELTIKNVIEALEADKTDLHEQIVQIEKILDRHYSQLMRLEEKKKLTSNELGLFNSEPENGKLTRLTRTRFPDKNIFPHDEHLHVQIKYVLKHIGRAIRKPDLQIEYKRLSGKDNKLDTAIRKMKIGGKLVTAKYNNTWTQTYYGLPNWVVIKGDKKVFLEANQPSKQDLPTGLNTLEWIKIKEELL